MEYSRDAAVAYAHRWAYYRNPEYFDFSDIGGDCTNFASQCIFAGSGVMNYTPTYGWFYVKAGNYAPAWTGVKYLYNFLTTNRGAGPYGRECDIGGIMPGDVVQIATTHDYFHHTPVVVEVRGNTAEDIFVAAHYRDCDLRPLASYFPKKIRYIHIDGVRR